MKNTETYFGLQEIDGKITANDGETFLKSYQDMSSDEFNELVTDIENWKEETLTEQDIDDLKEVLNV